MHIWERRGVSHVVGLVHEMLEASRREVVVSCPVIHCLLIFQVPYAEALRSSICSEVTVL